MQGTPIITPLNNLVYNLDPEKLASHGVHPLYLHIAVNLPLLFGPLVLLAAYAILRSAVTLRLTAGNLPRTCEYCYHVMLKSSNVESANFWIPLVQYWPTRASAASLFSR